MTDLPGNISRPLAHVAGMLGDIGSALTLKETQACMAQLGHTPSKLLGQNFLVDKNLVLKAVQWAQLGLGTRVLEVGPGLGTLTRALLATGATVYAVEKDDSLAAYLQTHLVPQAPGLHLLHADALDYPWAGLPQVPQEPYSIVANLPYAIATPWLDRILAGAVLPQRMVLMLQYEAAQRFQAACGTKHYSAISIRLQSAYCLSALHKVSGRCFFPVPAVESALVHWELLPRPHVFEARVHDFIRHVFMRRRKQIRHLCHTLPEYADLWEPWLCTLPQLTLRPEAIPLVDWQRLGSLP